MGPPGKGATGSAHAARLRDRREGGLRSRGSRQKGNSMSISHFILKNQADQEVKFADFKGRKMLLSFHPMAWTRICNIQMQDLDARHDRFTARGITPFGLSIDQQFCKKAWGESLGLKQLQLLSDFWPHGALAEALGCFIAKAGVSGRQNYLIGPDGEVLWTRRHDIKEQPDFDRILEELPA